MKNKYEADKYNNAIRQMVTFEEDIQNTPTYKNFYEASKRILNKGCLTLVKEELFPWAINLIKKIRQNITVLQLESRKGEALKNGFD